MNLEDDFLYYKAFLDTSSNPLRSKFVNIFYDYDAGTLPEVEYIHH